MTKQYIGFVNDHSGSMGHLAKAAIVDYNATITAVKDAATREMLDTIVSVIGIGLGNGVQRQVVISNPHVLKPITKWPTPGGTPLYDGIGDMIELFESLPDYKDPNVSFLIISTTDGEECSSRKYNATSLRSKMNDLERDGRWTLVFRVPEGKRDTLNALRVAHGNIQEWGVTAEGMAKSTEATKTAFNQFYATRAAGQSSSTVFYADASAVDISALVDITSKVSLYVVPVEYNGRQIRDFILTKRMKYLKGAAFYQLTKTESKVSRTKLVLVRVRSGKDAGKIYGGVDARKMIGMPTDRNARLHPGDHGNYDIFIQSESVNRHLVSGTGVVYWEEKGVEFTQAELDKFNGVAKAPVAPAAIVLPAVPVSTKPTPSPLKPTPKVPALPVFDTRDEARAYARVNGKSLKDLGVYQFPRWTVK